jgi:hypothetical protein
LCGVRGQSAQRLCWFILGVAEGKPRDAWYSPVGMPNVSQAGLESVSGVQVSSSFLSVTWHGETFHGLGVQGVKV